MGIYFPIWTKDILISVNKSLRITSQKELGYIKFETLNIITDISNLKMSHETVIHPNDKHFLNISYKNWKNWGMRQNNEVTVKISVPIFNKAITEDRQDLEDLHKTRSQYQEIPLNRILSAHSQYLKHL